MWGQVVVRDDVEWDWVEWCWVGLAQMMRSDGVCSGGVGSCWLRGGTLV